MKLNPIRPLSVILLLQLSREQEDLKIVMRRLCLLERKEITASGEIAQSLIFLSLSITFFFFALQTTSDYMPTSNLMSAVFADVIRMHWRRIFPTNLLVFIETCQAREF